MEESGDKQSRKLHGEKLNIQSVENANTSGCLTKHRSFEAIAIFLYDSSTG